MTHTEFRLRDVDVATLNILKSDIDKNRDASIPQPIVIIGCQGSGKTTLLRQLFATELNNGGNHVWIDGRSIFSSADIIEHPGISNKSIVFIDNMDFFFTRCSYDEQYRLRRYLYNEGAPMVIGSVETVLSAFADYKAPFFDGLKYIYIPPLDFDRYATKLFHSVGSISRAKKLYSLLPPTIKSIRIVYDIVTDNENSGHDIPTLLSVFEEKYRNLYASLPVYSQLILNSLSKSEDVGLLSGEIRKITDLPTNILPIYLKKLHKLGIITADKSVKRNTRYSVRDPLFKLWLSKTLPQ